MLRRPYAARPAAIATAWVPTIAALDSYPHATVRRAFIALDHVHAKSGEPRIHLQSPRYPRVLLCTSRENATGWSDVNWDRLSRPPSRPPTPTAVRAGGPGITSATLTLIGEHPIIEIRGARKSSRRPRVCRVAQNTRDLAITRSRCEFNSVLVGLRRNRSGSLSSRMMSLIAASNCRSVDGRLGWRR
jgi:hypothetical protein